VTAHRSPDDALDPSPTDATSVLTRPATEDASVDVADGHAEQETRWAEAGSGATALTWVDPVEIAHLTPTGPLTLEADPEAASTLLRGARLRSRAAGPGILVPVGALIGLLATYAGATLLWPLHELPPTVQATEFAPTAAAPADIIWPAQGSAAVGIGGLGTTASSLDPAVIASVTKVVSSLMVLDRMPLAVGEQGPEFAFTRADNRAYWEYRRSDQSALDVPVGGTLTEYQLLQGTLMGSANNYIDRLAREIWGSESAFASAATVWLRDRGLDGITIATPSGFDARNTATPESLIALAERAMQNPVFASIVSTPSVDLPGAGTVVNTNGMLADAGVVGVKTGTLGDSWNLLTAKDITVDDTTVRMYAAVLGQIDDEQRLSETRALFAQVEASLTAQQPAVTKDAVIGTVTTLWGATVDIVADADADVILWNGAGAQSTPTFDLGDHRDAGDEVGTLLVAGPLNSVVTPLALADDVDGPSPWWRLTHPLELFGLTEAQR
jgi:serine-type D-Ala-D-Ala carboxypeptidase (penicillin-binding protein 5/6)